MSKNTYTFPMEKLLPDNTNGDKDEVCFYWDADSKTWSVTRNGQSVSGDLAAALIAAAKAQGMVDPEQEQEQDEDLDFDLDR